MSTPRTFAREMKPATHPPIAHPAAEPLESRIAPATIFVGNPGANDTEYSDSPFVNTEGAADALSLQVGGGAVGVADTFYLRLAAGDKVILFTPVGQTEFIKVNAGSVVAFFVDKNLNNEVDANELTGLALGNGASVQVAGTVFGDVVANLNTGGTLDLASSPTALQQNIAKLQVLDVTGGILAGGSIKNVSAGNVGRILSGSAINGVTFDFFPGVAGGDAALAFTPVAGQAGAPISNVLVKSIADRIEAGAGGTGAPGGSLQSIRVTADTDGLLLKAGAGGNGSVADARINGGAGGKLNNIYVSGFADPTLNSPGGLRMVAGDGGDAAPGTAGKGGAGGSVTKAFVGFDLRGGKAVFSNDLSRDRVSITAGGGGDGLIAGAGGSIQQTKVRTSALDGAGADNEIGLTAGKGGDAFAGGKAGAGGSVSNVDLRNQNANAFTADIAIFAGDGGLAPADAAGAKGGSVLNATLLGSELAIVGGIGSGGKTGAAGGDIRTVTVVPAEGIIARAVALTAGRGGDGAAGNAGNGGQVNGLRIDACDFINFTVVGGLGGTSATAVGGKGGGISKISALEAGGALQGPVSFTAGNGGNGGTKGGDGGGLSNLILSGNNFSVVANAGNGGAATVAGNGGKGGGVDKAQISSLGFIGVVPVAGTFTAGTGGDGKGATGAGGSGGGIKTLNINMQSNVTLTAGTGGNGDGGAAGAGGSVSKSGAFSDTGSGTMRAGDAGLTGAKPGAGGSILAQSVLRAATSITLRAGDGFNGGAGGSIRDVTFASSAASLLPAPTGNVLVQAGAGSGKDGFAGAGGSLINVAGFASSGGASTTVIQAGVGGGALKGAAGGSITGLQIGGGGAAGGLITIAAGDAGDATASPTGAKGGDVRNVIVTGLATGSILRSIAAGDGGDATAQGGAGGSVQGVTVLNLDIGQRSTGGAGPTFGIAGMGGIFAGVGGAGTVKGGNGSVIDVRANGIAAIVAGRGATPDLVNRVEKITVGTANQPVDLLRAEDNDIDLTDGGLPDYGRIVAGRYASSNLVGFLWNPSRVDANKFAFTNVVGSADFELGDQPIDGLIMAQFINLRTFNFTPEAYFTPADGLADSNNRLS